MALAARGRRRPVAAHRGQAPGVGAAEAGHHSPMVAPTSSIRATAAPRAAAPSAASSEPATDFSAVTGPDDSTPSATTELLGEPDGSELQLASGIRISLRKVGKARVSTAELQRIVAGISLLPAVDQALVARAGVAISLLPVPALEQGISGTDELGATDLDPNASGQIVPTAVRVAVRGADQTGPENPAEIVQHELGHVVSVLERGDRSEQAAIDYAKRY